MKVITKIWSLNNLRRILKDYNETQITLVFNKTALNQQEKKIASKLGAFEISISYPSIYSKEFYKIIGKNSNRLRLPTKDGLNIIKEIITKFKLYDFYIIGKSIFISINHDRQIGIILINNIK